MDFALAKSVMDSLYDGINGTIISSEARKKLGYYDHALTYGEITPEGFNNILKVVSPKSEEVFIDLGCGTGKAVIMASLAFPFAKTIGIELLPDLYNTAQDIRQKLETQYPDLKTKPEFVLGNFLEQNLMNADILFTHSTCFHDGEMQLLAKKLENIKSGARVITVSKQLDSPTLSKIKSDEFNFTWGKATVFFYQKTNPSS